ncbi:MAG: phosphotriesterase family protein [Vicinamibacterales bacterium]
MRTSPSRREWLAGAVGLLGAGWGSGCATGRSLGGSALRREVETVTGPIAAERLGLTLMHEHVLVDFIGAAHVSPSRYDADEVFRVVLPHLQQVRKLGCETLVECTPAYLGRDPRLLGRLSKASGLHILTNTGYYGAAKDKHLPAHAFTEHAEQLAARWTREWERGIGDTGIKPAFMKIGVDESPLSAVDATLVRAAALTQRETGLPIASHTTTGAAALDELDLLEGMNVPLSSFIWVHAHAERDGTFYARAARRGAWVEFDGISMTTVARHLALVQQMKQQQLLANVLVSHDAGWYRVGEPGGGEFRPFDTVFTTFVPAMKAAGFTDGEIRQLLVENPRSALGGGAARAAASTSEFA